MSSLEEVCSNWALGTPITLQSLASFHLLIPMDTLEETFPLYNFHFTEVFPPPPHVVEHRR